MGARRNVLMITADAWRADFADAWGGVELLSALAPYRSRTARFTRYYANAPWTTPALISVFTGEVPHRHKVFYEWSAPRRDTPSVGQTLAQAGWEVPNLTYLNKLDNYTNLGYEPAEAPPDADAERLLAYLSGAQEPFFAWFHYKWTHLPYWADAPFRARLGVNDDDIPERLRESVCTGFVVPRHQFTLEADDAEMIQRLYAASVLQLNDWLTRVLALLEARGLMDDTCVVLTSDHGEELMDHGHVGHASTAHHGHLHEEVLRIPLFVLDPTLPSAVQVDERVQGVDLFPTLLSLAGHDAPPCQGVDLRAAAHGDAAAMSALSAPRDFLFHSARKGCPTPREQAHQFVEGLSDGRHKIIRERYDETRTFLYDLQADPMERAPISEGAEFDALLKRLNDVTSG